MKKIMSPTFVRSWVRFFDFSRHLRTVSEIVADEFGCFLELGKILDRSIEDLSGGELQRFACAMVCIQNGDIFMFDEPSSYLDVKQRLKAAVTIRSLIQADKLVSTLRRFSFFNRVNVISYFNSGSLSSLSTIYQFWTIYQILFVVCTGYLVPTALLLCLSQFVKVSNHRS